MLHKRLCDTSEWWGFGDTIPSQPCKAEIFLFINFCSPTSTLPRIQVHCTLCISNPPQSNVKHSPRRSWLEWAPTLWPSQIAIPWHTPTPVSMSSSTFILDHAITQLAEGCFYNEAHYHQGARWYMDGFSRDKAMESTWWSRLAACLATWQGELGVS